MYEVIGGNFEYIGFKWIDIFGCNVFVGDLICHVFVLIGMYFVGMYRKKSFGVDFYVGREIMFSDVE